MNVYQLLSEKIPTVVNKLSGYKFEHLARVLTVLGNRGDFLGVLLGGSLTYKEDNEKSDIDLFCLFQDTTNHANITGEIVGSLTGIDVTVHQGYFPWTQQLYTLYYESDLDFSIDLCLISLQAAANFFWEPTGTILIDRQVLITTFRNNQISDAHFPRHPFLKPNPFSQSVVTLKKIEKNLVRNHLWNALELLSVFRRYIMQIVRCYVIPEHTFIGRVDRDIEDVLPTDVEKQLVATVARYDGADIATKTVLLIEMLRALIPLMAKTNEHYIQEWLGRQLDQEQNKLLTYVNNAQA